MQRVQAVCMVDRSKIPQNFCFPAFYATKTIPPVCGMHRLGTGWFFSEGIFYNENGSIEVATRYAIAEEETTLWLIDREHFVKLLENRQFVEAILHSTVEKCTILRYEIESLTFDSTSDRLKKLLLSCVDSGRLNDGGWYDLCVAWTHQSIAAVQKPEKIHFFFYRLRPGGRPAGHRPHHHRRARGRLLRRHHRGAGDRRYF